MIRFRFFAAAVAAFSLCAGISFAQIPGEFAVRPAGSSDGRILTMEEAVLSRDLIPENINGLRWNPAGTGVIFNKDGEKHSLLLKSMRKFGGENAAASSLSQKFLPDEAICGIIPRKIDGMENVKRGPGGLWTYTVGNGLYICRENAEIITVEAPENPAIVCGQTVSRNEFGIDGGTFWSPEGSLLAYYVKDESAVSQFPLLDITSRTGTLRLIRYPMAGMASEKVYLRIFDPATASVRCTIDASRSFTDERYLTNVTWSPDERHVFVQVLSRDQKHMFLNMYDASTGQFVKAVLEESDSRYVEPLDPIRFIDNERFIYRTNNRDGYRNLYICDIEGNVRRLTETDADVAYVAHDGKYVYYTSAEVSPVENHLFRVDMRSGKTQRLTFEPGWHNIAMSPDCSHFIDSYSSLTVPRVIDVRKNNGDKVCNLLTAEDPAAEYAYSEISLGTVESADGQYLNYYRLVKPKDFDPSKKYPVILYVYGGPHSQLVRNTYLAELRRWEMYMAQRGYLVYIQDNRGTENRGRAFEQAIYGQCGQAEMADQMKGMEMLMNLPFVDRNRIGVHGWSYGGFMTISLITNYPDIFKVAVAGGPVIDWKWYEVMYGERYMGSPSENAEGYEKVSLMNRAEDLKGRLLICQGAVDNVVVWQHSLNFIQKCIDSDVRVDYFPYPVAEHNVMGRNRVHLMDKVTLYFEDYL